MEFSAHRVRAKTRSAVRKREDDVETEEMESGEINLVPYLDIVTNLMLVFLSAVSSGLIFSQINTTLPDSAKPGVADKQTDTKPEDLPVKMVVTATRDKVIVWSFSQQEGTLKEPKATFPLTGTVGNICDGNYMCQSGACELATKKCVASTNEQVPVFDYRGLNTTLYEIANRRYGGKPRGDKTYQITFMADGATPYSTLVSIMGAMRCKLPEVGKNVDDDSCYLPTDDDKLKKATDPIDKKSRLFDTTRANYDATKMALFSDILFSTGFQ
jgi:biopolymer transport protein ExbD